MFALGSSSPFTSCATRDMELHKELAAPCQVPLLLTVGARASLIRFSVMILVGQGASTHKERLGEMPEYRHSYSTTGLYCTAQSARNDEATNQEPVACAAACQIRRKDQCQQQRFHKVRGKRPRPGCMCCTNIYEV